MGVIVLFNSNKAALRKRFNINIESPEEAIIALAGNPNTGKSTIFNNLTGMKQHTGNWPGKTVSQTQGKYILDNKTYIVTDLPGTYSLFANSIDEKIARDFICFAHPDATVVVVDATCLERNLNMVLQVMEITPDVIVCLNLIDEAERKAIKIDFNALSAELGVPVVPTAARNGRGILDLKKAVKNLVAGNTKTTPRRIQYDWEIEKAVEQLEIKIKAVIPDSLINPRWIALRLIDGDRNLLNEINAYAKAMGY